MKWDELHIFKSAFDLQTSLKFIWMFFYVSMWLLNILNPIGKEPKLIFNLHTKEEECMLH